MMSIGMILSNFDERNGFIPVIISSSDIDKKLIKEIVFRSTLNLVGGSKNISEDRETFIDFPEYHLIGCSYLTSVESSAIRGGNMPVITILFAPTEYRNYIYNHLVQIMGKMKELMFNIIPNWKENKFHNQNKIQTLISEYISDFKLAISSSSLEKFGGEGKKFIISCPECSQEIEVLVPMHITNLLVIPISNSPCKHHFEAYFTRGPNFRGTSKPTTQRNDELKDILENL